MPRNWPPARRSRTSSGRSLPRADEELADDWREGGYPYKHLMLRRETTSAEVPPAGGAAQAAGLGQGDRAARGDPLRGPRCRRQGGHDQALHGAPQPARRARRRPGEAQQVERGQWYFQRYVQHLPTAGEIVLFDRSWYNRAGVERVMGFCSDAEYQEFMRQAPEFERTWCAAGVHLIKFWFSVSR
jgi:hypothetical protein